LIRLVIADDHELIREGIKKIVRPCTDLKIVGEAADLKQAIALIAQVRPDVVVLDISLPDSDGLDGLATLRRHFPAVRIVMLSMHPEERYALPSMRAGALAYVSKAMASTELVDAIRAVAGGTPWRALPARAPPYLDATRIGNRVPHRGRPADQAGRGRTGDQRQFGEHVPEPDLPQDGHVVQRGADPLRAAARPLRLSAMNVLLSNNNVKHALSLNL